MPTAQGPDGALVGIGDPAAQTRPATAMAEVSGLVDPDMLVEMEAVAIVAE